MGAHYALENGSDQLGRHVVPLQLQRVFSIYMSIGSVKTRAFACLLSIAHLCRAEQLARARSLQKNRRPAIYRAGSGSYTGPRASSSKSQYQCQSHHDLPRTALGSRSIGTLRTAHPKQESYL